MIFQNRISVVSMILFGCSNQGEKDYIYEKSPHPECDFDSPESCWDNGCRWKMMTDAVAIDEPEPFTCCPTWVKESFDNPSLDPCITIHG